MLFKLFHNSRLQTKGPALEHFSWHRIVVDEAHELIEDEVYAGKK